MYLVSDLATWTAYWANGPEDAKHAADKGALELAETLLADNIRTGSVVVTDSQYVTDRTALQGGFAVGETFNI